MTTKASAELYKAVDNSAITPISLTHITTYQSGVVQSAAHRALKRVVDAALKPHHLTMMQWLLIGTVYEAGLPGMRMTDLANRLGTTLPYATTTVKALEQKAILQRSSGGTDSRSRIVALNPEYAPKMTVIEKDLRQYMRESIYAKVTPEELRVYIGVLYKLASV